MARRTLGLVRPGETLVVVSSSAPARVAPEAAGTPAPGAAHTPAAEWWKDLFVQPAPAPTPVPAAAP